MGVLHGVVQEQPVPTRRLRRRRKLLHHRLCLLLPQKAAVVIGFRRHYAVGAADDGVVQIEVAMGVVAPVVLAPAVGEAVETVEATGVGQVGEAGAAQVPCESKQLSVRQLVLVLLALALVLPWREAGWWTHTCRPWLWCSPRP